MEHPLGCRKKCQDAFRVATLQIGSDSVIVAAENYVYDEEIQGWKPKIGIHDFPLYPNRNAWNNFDVFGSLTPVARNIVEYLAQETRDEFKRWVEESEFEPPDFKIAIVG